MYYLLNLPSMRIIKIFETQQEMFAYATDNGYMEKGNPVEGIELAKEL